MAEKKPETKPTETKKGKPPAVPTPEAAKSAPKGKPK